MVLKNNNHLGDIIQAIGASGDSTSEVDPSPTRNHAASLGQADIVVDGRNTFKCSASKNSQMKSNSNVMSAEETLLSGPLIVCDIRGDQKSLVQDSDGNSSSRRANHSTHALCFISDKDNHGASCGTGTINNHSREVEADDGVSISGSQELGCDIGDRHLECKNRCGVLEASKGEITSLSSSDQCHYGSKNVIKSNKRDDSDEIRAPVPTPPESDVEEEDVKVCDICGDAGREDLLAVCSRCSDGAEHTYCMRQMLDKVPEGDWLCEECKCVELPEAQKFSSRKLATHERSKFVGRTSSLVSDFSLKLDSNDPFCERPKPLNISLNRQASSKRSGERMESFPTAKKQAFESSKGSPTTSSPSRMAVLSKDGFLKNLDKFKGKTSNQISVGIESTGDSSEDARSPTANSPHVLKGNFLKSNSFSSSNSKQNVKVSEDVHRKHGLDAKEGVGKLLGKSMSFKGLGRSSSIEPKVKMLPAKCAPGQDLKGQKHGRDRSSFERRNLTKLDHSLPGQIAANPTKRPSRGTDGNSTLSMTHIRDKNVQTDAKLSNMAKPADHFAQKSSEFTTNLGEVKKLPSTVIVGSASVNGTGNAIETKLNHFSVKDGSMIGSPRTADASLTDGAKLDWQNSESEKAPESYSGRSRQCLSSGMVNGGRRRLPLDASALKTKDGLHEENKLKAAIEAAMQKKQDIFKKNKIPEKATDFPIPNSQGFHGANGVSNQVRDSMSEDAMHEGSMDLHDTYSNLRKQMPLSGGKQFKSYHADFEKSPAIESVLTVSAIPEQDSVWQGGFEIHRNGKLPDLCGGFQAHMSNFASGKVFEVVGKLPQKIVFSEVPRPCAWPVQFKEFGAREDSIALYFFAKDTESYMRSYKILVDYMMKHDLALRGNINGVELLVFPSNHLPHKSKCWNTLYFIWGVFRGWRPRFPDNRFGSLGKCEISAFDKVVLDKDVTSVENPCLHKPAAEHLSVAGRSHNYVSECEGPVIAGSSLQLCASSSNGDCYKEECPVGGTCLSSPICTGNHNERPKNHCSSLGGACSELRSALRDHRQNRNSSPLPSKLPSEVTLDNQDSSPLPSKLLLVGKQEGDNVDISVNSQVLDTECDYTNSKVKSESSLKREKLCLDNMHDGGQVKHEHDIDNKEDMNHLLKYEAKVKSESDLRSELHVDINISADSNVDDLHVLQYSPQRHSQADSVEAISLSAAAITCQKKPWVDRIDTSEDGEQSSLGKSIKGLDSFSRGSLYGCPSVGHRLEAQMDGVSASSHKEDTSNEADIEKPSAEGCFFLVDSHPVHMNIEPGVGPLPLGVALSEHEDRLPGGSPNLELALGVKKKQARESLLPFLAGVDDRKDPDRLADVVASSKEENGDASASLSLSLGFSFPDLDKA